MHFGFNINRSPPSFLEWTRIKFIKGLKRNRPRAKDSGYINQIHCFALRLGGAKVMKGTSFSAHFIASLEASEMGRHFILPFLISGNIIFILCCNFFFHLIILSFNNFYIPPPSGLICVTQISSLTLRRATDESQMVANMLELARAADIKAACPRSDTFCLPRVKCPVKSVVYDREAQRFKEGVDKVIFQSIRFKCYFSSRLFRWVLIYFEGSFNRNGNAN